MADYVVSDRVTHERVYTLRLPSNAAEVEKMLSGVRQDLLGAFDGPPPDDAVRVEADEEELRLVLVMRATGE
jgi:hypothetical protein